MKEEHRYKPDTPVQYLKGVGPRMAEKLAGLGLRTLEDVLYYFPRDWEDRRQFVPILGAQVDREMTFRGTVKGVHFAETRGGFAIVTALISDGTGELACKWMRRRSFKYDVLQTFRKEFQPGRALLVHGKIERDLSGLVMMVTEHDFLAGSPEDQLHVGRIVPIYPATEGLTPKFLRRIAFEALQASGVEDPVPAAVRDRMRLMPISEALRHIHFPDRMEDKDEARRRLAFQELFSTQSVLALVRRRRRAPRTNRYEVRKTLLTPFRERLGYDFTRAQKKVINEIFSDLTSEYPMNRLLQGDVGSGKTVVALSAMLLACENGLQSVLMAPTEILAEQHDITLRHLLDGLPVRVGLLTGSAKSKQRKAFLEACAKGEIDVAIGTHALLEKEVKFKNCGLVVIDEQHRFGVRHRLELTQRKPQPDVLVMTATPIPRTLALSLYGDLDVSTIDELPPGRQKIQTLVSSEDEAYARVKREIAKGRQAYVVYPLVDESSKVELKAAIQESERLRREVFPGARVGLLHGQMPGAEKERVMRDFYDGKFSILIATTVIEVGINVPNATVMIIQHAERFGLATLHQLRGRVGRGAEASYCVMIAHKPGPEALQRISLLTTNQNGFKLAEADLALRGPGEIFGTSQHGIPPFKIADFARDAELIRRSQEIAREWVDRDPELSSPESRALKDYLRKHFSKTWHWASIA